MPKKVNWSDIAKITLIMTPNLFGLGIDLKDILRRLKGDIPEIEEKAEEAAAALNRAAIVANDLKEEIESEAKRIEAIKQEHEKYKELAAIEETQAKALIMQLEEKLTVGKSRERWIALAINLIAGLIIFGLGVLASPYLKEGLDTTLSKPKTEQSPRGDVLKAAPQE